MWMFINFLRSPFFIHFWFLRCCAQCTFRIFKLNLIFVSGAFGQTHWRGRSRFPSNPPLFPPRPTNPEQPNCDQGDTTSNSCHGCHFFQLLITVHLQDTPTLRKLFAWMHVSFQNYFYEFEVEIDVRGHLVLELRRESK